MAVAQLSLWDNESLEQGYRCLASLALSDAGSYFAEALKCSFGEKESIQKAIDACDYWRPRINKSAKLNSPAITNLLTDYRQYPFTALLKGIKKSLLSYIIDGMSQQPDLNRNEMEPAFDLLLAVKDYQKAENFISILVSQNIEERYLLYFLAQAQWLNGNKVASMENYIIALMHYPEKSFINRIENKNIQSIVLTYGPAMAPAYCHLLGIIPFIPDVHNIKQNDSEHENALKCLHLMREANKALMNNDMKSSINYRKQLKAENATLYEVYFKMLKQRK